MFNSAHNPTHTHRLNVPHMRKEQSIHFPRINLNTNIVVKWKQKTEKRIKNHICVRINTFHAKILLQRVLLVSTLSTYRPKNKIGEQIRYL